MEIKLGRYRHYKNRDYEVIGVAKHSETMEELVVYHVCGQTQLWVRPAKMFVENVEVNGVTMPRFRFIGAGSDTVVLR